MYKDYFDYISQENKERKIYKQVCEQYGIDSKYYVPNSDTFSMCDVNFKKLCLKTPTYIDGEESYTFKKSSDIAKSWKSKMQSEKVEISVKPALCHYVSNFLYKTKSRLFDIGDILYASLGTEREYKIPNGWQEIKGSEFFKAIEEDKNNDI